MVVGSIAGISRYPIKSMRGEALDSVALGLQGVPDDRRFAFVQAASHSPFPWLTARELPALLRYQPGVQSSTGSRVIVQTPTGASIPVESEALRRELEEAFGGALYLLRDHRGNHDIAQVSLIGRATVAHIAAESGTAPSPERFRANFYLETQDGEPFSEDAWVSHTLRIGETARVAITQLDARCAIITLDPASGASEPVVLEMVQRLHANRAGVYGVVLTPGVVRVGDGVAVEG